MKKPKKKVISVYDWDDIKNFIEKKYKINFFQEGRNFWHYITRECEIRRDSFFNLPEDYLGSAEDWQIEILNLIYTEFPELKIEKIYINW